MATTRAPVPPTSDTRQVGGTNGHHPCTHAPNLRVAAAREQAWGSNRHPARLAAALCPASPTRSSPAPRCHAIAGYSGRSVTARWVRRLTAGRSEEHTSELQSLMRISYAVFCLKNKKRTKKQKHHK